VRKQKKGVALIGLIGVGHTNVGVTITPTNELTFTNLVIVPLSYLSQKMQDNNEKFFRNDL